MPPKHLVKLSPTTPWEVWIQPVVLETIKIFGFDFSCSVMSNSLWPHGLQHARLLCPSPTPEAYSNSCWWCYPTISSSIVPFSSCLQCFPASVFPNESVLCIRWPRYWSFSFSISPPSEHSRQISFRIDWLDLLESPLDCKKIQPVNAKGNESWIFIGRTDFEAKIPILWLPDAKNWLTGKDSDAGRD